MKVFTDYSSQTVEELRSKLIAKTGPELSTFDFRLSTGQQGFVSIFSVLIIMTILALITVGFSNVTRNAQRRTLDSQLNTQAFYSAESAINDAKAALVITPNLTKTVCQGLTPGFTYNNTLDPSRQVGYTCVLIDSQPPDLVFSSIAVEGAGNPTVVPFESSGGSLIAKFNVSWNTVSGLATIPSPVIANYPNLLVPNAVWGTNLGILRIDIVPTGLSFNRVLMESNSFTFFLYPTRNPGSNNITVANTSAQQGGLHMVTCAAAPCVTNINLNALPGTSLSGKYTMRLQALYNPVRATISNVRNTAGAVVNLQNGQAVVDATGKANDVFRRIQVRLPLTTRGLSPGFVIQSADSVCKRMFASPTGSITDVPDPACNLTN